MVNWVKRHIVRSEKKILNLVLQFVNLILIFVRVVLLT
jgi:hypothetical protein